MRLFLLGAALLILSACQKPTRSLSPCRAKVVKDTERYVSQHIPDGQWQPIIEAELRQCIEEQAKQ
jgi:hypothetical protein